MTPEQAEDLRYFTAAEIERTGARLQDVQLELMQALDSLRHELGRRIKLLKNGMTTGKHSSREHPEGRAVDFTLDNRDGPITQDTLYLIFTLGIRLGFRGFGYYFNGKTWSFHLDLRSGCDIWTGRKKAPGKGAWIYKRMSIGFPAH